MKITWLGHSCFKIETKDCIVFDPFEDGYVDGFKNIRESANVCICSHGHNDHNASENISIISKPLECTYSSIQTYHDDQKGALRGLNKITVIDDGTYRIAHFGDIGCQLEDDQIDKLKNLDVALIPVGGYFTIGSKQAFELVTQIQPKHIIPMHYKSDTFGYGILEKVEAFTKYFDDVKIADENSIDVENLTNKVTVLSYK